MISRSALYYCLYVLFLLLLLLAVFLFKHYIVYVHDLVFNISLFYMSTYIYVHVCDEM